MMELPSFKRLLLPILLLQSVLITVNSQSPLQLSVSDKDLTIVYEKSETFDVRVRGNVGNNFSLKFIEEHDDLILITPPVLYIPNSNGQNVSTEYEISILGVNPGRLEVYAEVDPEGYVNVVGLNFDFLALNMVGHSLYAVFNSSLYWSTYIEDEYFNKHPRGLNPVLLNDVLFSLHASVLTFLTIIQCFFYERGQQRVSYTAIGLICVAAVFLAISAIIAGAGTIHWLDFLYYCSYVKLAISIIKYLPQAYMNYKRQSTEGWSIENILLDFTGGTLSMLQMLLNGYNYDDWKSIFGDPTKFGLGLFSVLFDILFMVQHYVLYRHSAKNMTDYNSNSNSNINGNSNSTDTMADEKVVP